MTKRYVHEAGTLSKPKEAGAPFRVRVISEGEGATGIYSRELLEEYKDAFAGVLSYAGHPADPQKPWTRPMMGESGIVGRVGEEIEFKVGDDGVAYLEADYFPSKRQEVQEFFEEYGEHIGASIYIAADGKPNNDDKIVVEAFDRTDPFRSVDAVIAAGRGGRFERAAEAYRALESSIGNADGNEAGVISAPGKEGNMDEKVLEELQKLTNLLTPVVAFVTESKESQEKEVQAEADADAIETAVSEALSGFREKISAIEAETDLLPSQKKALMESAERGEDISAALESAKAIAAEARTVVAEGAGVARGIVSETSTKSALDLGKALG